MASLKTRLVDVPILLFVGTNDYFVAEADFKYLLNNLPSSTQVVSILDYNHLDYMWGDDANKYVANDVFAFLEKL